MILRLISNIVITQQPTSDFTTRNNVYSFDFLHETEATDTWEDLTNTGSITFPKNIYFKDQNGSNISLYGKNLTSGQNTIPILLRGDKITISCGYKYVDSNGEQQQLNQIFKGYISNIINKLPVTLYLEDNMWKLKQMQAPNKLFKASQYNLQQMLQELLAGTGFTLRTDIKTSVGDFITQNETVAQVLQRIQNDYRIESYFKNDELTCSGLVYYPSDRKTLNFGFQQNIIEDELEYRRKNDVHIGVKAYSINESELNTTTKDGSKKTKKQRLEVTVGPQDGELRTLYFWNVKSITELTAQAKSRLNRIYYEGFYGNFTAFGLPFVRQGDAVALTDSVLPERNGTYLVKRVDYYFGMTGFRQKIYIDIRIDILPSSEVNSGL